MGLLVLLTRRIVLPIRALSQRTTEVATGRFEEGGDVAPPGNDEVGDLARSFTAMTRSLRETTVSKSYVDEIIRSMADTLVVLDAEVCIRTAKRAALRLLDQPEADLLGRPFATVCPDLFDGTRFPYRPAGCGRTGQDRAGGGKHTYPSPFPEEGTG